MFGTGKNTPKSLDIAPSPERSERIEVVPPREFSQRIGKKVMSLNSVQEYFKSINNFNNAFDNLNATAARKANEFRNGL